MEVDITVLKVEFHKLGEGEHRAAMVIEQYRERQGGREGRKQAREITVQRERERDH